MHLSVLCMSSNNFHCVTYEERTLDSCERPPNLLAAGVLLGLHFPDLSVLEHLPQDAPHLLLRVPLLDCHKIDNHGCSRSSTTKIFPRSVRH